jgi:antitoxin ParD1/3/4
MNVTLTPEMEEFVKQKIELGKYESSGDVVIQALMMMEEWEKFKALRRDIQEGLESGKSTVLNMDEIIAEAEREFDRRSLTRR